MDGTIILNLALIALFILLTAFFVGAEFAILKVRMSRIDQLISEGNKKAIIAKKVTQNLDYYLSACQLGITVTALILGALGEPTVEKILAPVFDYLNLGETVSTALSYAIALSVVTFLHVVLGELMPKTLAIQYADKMTLLLAPPLYWFGQVSKPFIAVLNGSAQLLLKGFGVKPAGHDEVYSEEELKLIVTQSYEGGEINQTELAYLENIFAFDSRQLKDIMIPRSKMVMLEKQQTLEQMIAVIEEFEYTRYPVIDVTKKKNDVIGFINTKEMLTDIAVGRSNDRTAFIHDILRFKHSTAIKEVFLKMQQSHKHMGVVTDGKGAIIGLVTMEDILSEIVGEIQDDGDIVFTTS
ncbi:transporter associated domain protein [Solibacillus sp. R5-41]|uniref:hemolysin family protein n=1 Tax=Solibacillus sp. R5-41 TaxID=2048654 RepID=UPI000C129194|nr:hemolysin family protein [Solibacillus sp. R5-41]ATP39546.1 transporter associated domain protein [Solibacillus sp. R5-41]